MSAFPSLPLFTDAFIADTGHLSAQETGAYLLLLMVAWRGSDCRLPDDDAKLARWARVDRRTWLRIKPTVMEFWTLCEGFWTQKRLAKEREIVSKRADAARQNGRHGGRPKSLEDNDPYNPPGSARDSGSKAPNPNPNITPVVPKGTDPPGFAEFWAAYPERSGANPQKTAVRAYAKALRDGMPPADLLAAARAYARDLAAKGRIRTEFVAQASTWLNQERWKDHAARAAAGGTGSSEARDAGLVDVPEARWRISIERWKHTVGAWDLAAHSPPPDDPRTKVPQRFLDEYGIRPRTPPPDVSLLDRLGVAA